MTEAKTHTLDVPGAVLHYDVRSNDASTEPVLLMIGSPMGAEGFGTLAGHFTDRTVVTYDPRAAGRSVRTDGALVTTPDEHADDLRRLITALDAGPVDIFASSGGAVNALALVARHPEQVRTLVAHEPPVSQELPDREAALAACVDISETYQHDGFGPAMAKFIALISVAGPLPDDYASRPGPDPAAFGLPAEDDGSRSDPLLGQNMISCNHYRHDFSALRAAPTRVVIGVGATSGSLLPGRAAVAVAARLGTAPVTFPGDHGGFLGGEYGQVGEPDAFAATLREVLAGLSGCGAYLGAGVSREAAGSLRSSASAETAAPVATAAATTSRQATVNSVPASAIITTRRLPSASLATGTWATATVAAFAISSSPISGALTPIWFRAYGGMSQVKAPQPTAMIATLMQARWTKARSRRTTR